MRGTLLFGLILTASLAPAVSIDWSLLDSLWPWVSPLEHFLTLQLFSWMLSWYFFAVFHVIAFDELKTDFKNPIDQCSTLNPLVLPEYPYIIQFIISCRWWMGTAHFQSSPHCIPYSSVHAPASNVKRWSLRSDYYNEWWSTIQGYQRRMDQTCFLPSFFLLLFVWHDQQFNCRFLIQLTKCTIRNQRWNFAAISYELCDIWQREHVAFI